MHFTTLALAALATLTGVDAQSRVISVQVGRNGTVFSPNNIRAAVGDMIQFQFMGGNHTVTQSTFDQPCQPISQFNRNVTGVHSGFVPYMASAAMGEIPVYTIMVNNTTPMWMYCAQARHCQGGMVLVVNENTAANSSRSLTSYRAAAATVAQASFPGGTSGGTTGTGTATGTGTGTGTDTAGTSTPPGSAGSMLTVPSTISLLGLVTAVFFF